METSRKRKLSTETSFLPQLKRYVTENVQNKQNEEKMKEIYVRTVDLLFKGAKQNEARSFVDKNERFRMLKASECNLMNAGKIPDWYTELPVIVCNSCMSNSKLSVDCINCNLISCERCGVACSGCREPLCHACVHLFNCGTMEQPVCHRCASF